MSKSDGTVVREKFIDAVPGADLPHDHANRDAQAADARLAAHDLGLLGDAIELSHDPLLIEKRCSH